MQTSKLLTAFKLARQDLGLDIVAPYEVDIGENIKVRAEILLKDFGGEKGTLIFTDTGVFWPYQDQLCKLGYGFSVLDEPSDDNTYDREGFIDMLSEWEWTGAVNSKPTWVREPPPEAD